MPAQTPDQFAVDILRTLAEVAAGTQAVVAKGAQNVKTEARANVQKSAPVHNGGAWQAITYDTDFDVRGGKFSAEIGYDKDIRVGRLGNLLEYGGGGDRSPAHRDVGRALDSEEPRFEEALKLMVGKLL